MTRTITSLSGQWSYRFPDGDWQPIEVPGCWEAASGIKNFSGPVWYHRKAVLPHLQGGQKTWLEFDGVSYACEVFLNDRPIGGHIGIWDHFRVPIPDDLSGQTVELLLQIEKPASLTAGPDSTYVDGNYPLRSTLSGFLPYVWGHMFGGIWQDVRLVCAGPDVIDDLQLRGYADGTVSLYVSSDQEIDLEIEIYDPVGHTVVYEDQQSNKQIKLHIPHPQCWQPHEPHLYTISVRSKNDHVEKSFGLRDLQVQDTDIVLSGKLLYPRLALSWGWYHDVLHSNPGAERIRDEFNKLKALGYNGVKLCLWVPPAEYFEIADQMGMLIWLELPMWLPKPNAHFRQHLMSQYEAIIRQTCEHPSVIMYTMGCELSKIIGPELLQPLYYMTKTLVGDALVRDNSGSGEAYGGLLNEYADFYDYHFYCDIHYFRELIDYFTPRWRQVQPWVFGEFCDLDTFRGIEAPGERGTLPWWYSTDPLLNPQGARWLYELPFQEQRLREHGLLERSAELEQLSYQHAFLHRKWTLETVRSYREISGYVITGEVDTPIGTAGMWNDAGQLKFDAEAFRAFNADTVLCIGWDKRRDWVHGGDRAAYWDTWSYTSGEEFRAHLILSHYGDPGSASVRWSVTLPDCEPFSSGENQRGFRVGAAEVRSIGLVESKVPHIQRPQRAILEAEWWIDQLHGANSWEVCFFPAQPWSDIAPLIYDPPNILKGLDKAAPTAIMIKSIVAPSSVSLSHAIPLITTVWTEEIAHFVRNGGRAILLQQADGPAGPIPTKHMPFWREALRVAESHPAWGDFPHKGWADITFYGCATDLALKTAEWDGPKRSILRRIDVRTMELCDYAVELEYGTGQVIISTLRFQGGHGDQPVGIGRNTAAMYLLGCWVRYLARLT